MTTKFIILGLVGTLACVTTACNKKSEPFNTASSTQTTATVLWFSGYTMPALLAEPTQPSGPRDLAEIAKRKWYAEFKVYKESAPDKVITLSTCEAYLPYANQRLWTVVDKENTPFMEIAVMCKATQAMLAATKPEKSYLQDIKFDKNLPNTMPADLAMIISTSEKARIVADKSIKHWQDVYPITKIEDLGQFHANYLHEGGAQELELVAKGDFNSDKIEDVLITSRDSVEGGSYSAVRLFIITKTSEAGEMLVVKEFAN